MSSEKIRSHIENNDFHLVEYKELENHLDKLHDKYTRTEKCLNEDFYRTVIKINLIKDYLNNLNSKIIV